MRSSRTRRALKKASLSVLLIPFLLSPFTQNQDIKTVSAITVSTYSQMRAEPPIMKPVTPSQSVDSELVSAEYIPPPVAVATLVGQSAGGDFNLDPDELWIYQTESGN